MIHEESAQNLGFFAVWQRRRLYTCHNIWFQFLPLLCFCSRGRDTGPEREARRQSLILLSLQRRFQLSKTMLMGAGGGGERGGKFETQSFRKRRRQHAASIYEVHLSRSFCAWLFPSSPGPPPPILKEDLLLEHYYKQSQQQLASSCSTTEEGNDKNGSSINSTIIYKTGRQACTMKAVFSVLKF